MTVNSVIGILALPALSFGLLYFPALTRISPALASPYPKADFARRVLAAALDGVLFLTSLYFFLHSESAWFIAAGAVYVGLRDAMRGRSVGKFFAGLVVISLETGKPCSLACSATRNLVFLFPGANLVAVVLEVVTAGRDPWGYRLGDRMARTQVVEGFGAKELAASFLRWWVPPTLRPHGRRTQPVSRSYPLRRFS